MKLWQLGVRIFKGVNKSRIYHFGSLTTRKNKHVIQNNARKTFLMEMENYNRFFHKILFIKRKKFDGPLKNPNFNLSYIFGLILTKLIYYFYKWKKLIVRIAEGLGNQLFMYANAYALSKDLPLLTLYIDDKSGFIKTKSFREYYLDKFNLTSKIIPDGEKFHTNFLNIKRKLLKKNRFF